MKLALIAAVAMLTSCKDNARAPSSTSSPGSGAPASPSPSPSPSPSTSTTTPPATTGAAPAAPAAVPTTDACWIGLAALDGATCKTTDALKSLMGTRKSIESVVDTIRKVGGADPRQFQVMCAQMLLAIEQDATKLGCTVALEPTQRRDLQALLEAWYGQRTPVVPTGDAASDAVIARIAAVRDAACACKDAACLDGLNAQLAGVGMLPEKAPDAARRLGSKLLEDAGRCASRVRTMGAAPR
ncbi:MAG TPA: hypothetical protein VK932_27245 [Kofleriaceae bacterium]|nr:hypothetical protein [Kofleriaceae bacterium]